MLIKSPGHNGRGFCSVQIVDKMIQIEYDVESDVSDLSQ